MSPSPLPYPSQSPQSSSSPPSSSAPSSPAGPSQPDDAPAPAVRLPAALEPVASRLGSALLSIVARVPRSSRHGTSRPAADAHALGRQAALKAAVAAGSLALPPGPLGWLTIVPELMAIWRIQSALVADIAAVYGRGDSLGREKMLYCMFRHVASQAVRDLAVNSGQRLLFQPASLALLQRVARQLGLKVSQQTVGRGVARLLPLVGVAGVGAWAWRDTQRVARTAIELFEGERDADETGAAARMPARR